MDSLTQIALGAAVGVAVMGRRTAVWKAALWGGIAGTLPDLDVLIDLCDRVLVLCGGRNNGIVEGRKTSKEEAGLLMTKLREPQEKGGVA